jgi:uncharacterized protein YaaQ
MKFLIAVVHTEDVDSLIESLTQKKYQATRIDSSGGFLKGKNATIFLGVDDKKVSDVLKIIKTNCKSRTEYVSPAPSLVEPGEFFMPTSVKVKIGGATVFILSIEKHQKL